MLIGNKTINHPVAGQDVRLEAGWNVPAFILTMESEKLFRSNDGWEKQRKKKEAIHDSDSKDWLNKNDQSVNLKDIN